MKDPHMIGHQAYLADIERLATKGPSRPLRLPIAGFAACLAAAVLFVPFLG